MDTLGAMSKIRKLLSEEAQDEEDIRLWCDRISHRVIGCFGFVSPGAAVAKTKKLTFEQAWKVCKQRLDKENASGTMLQANERFIKGGACMKEHGYDL